MTHVLVAFTFAATPLAFCQHGTAQSCSETWRFLQQQRSVRWTAASRLPGPSLHQRCTCLSGAVGGHTLRWWRAQQHQHQHLQRWRQLRLHDS